MREVVMQTYLYCDIHSRFGEPKVDADEALTIKLSYQGRPKRIDLCAEHKNPTWEEITDCWNNDDDISPPRGTTSKVGYLGQSQTMPCVVPGCDARAASPQGVLAHIRRKHKDMPLGEAQRMLGFPVTDRNVRDPATNRKLSSRAHHQGGPKPNATVLTCPRCGVTARGVVGLNTHASRGHPELNKLQRAELIRDATDKAGAL